MTYSGRLRFAQMRKLIVQVRQTVQYKRFVSVYTTVSIALSITKTTAV